jgi:predicted transcriptional regulator
MTGSSLDPNTTAMAILKVVVDTKGINPYGISKKLKSTQAKICYHIPALEQAGLVVHDEATGVILPQPILVDPEFIAVVEAAIDTIYAAAAKVPDKVFMPSEKVEDVEAALENCIRARVSLSLCPQ